MLLFKLGFFILCSFFITAQSKEEKVVWNNLQNFLEAGWNPIEGQSSGVAFDKPSDLNSSLSALDDAVTGGGVWSGWSTGNEFYFQINSTELDQGMTEANFTIKYYCGDARGLGAIIFSPCSNSEVGMPDNICMGESRRDLEWVIKEYPVQIRLALADGFFLGGVTGSVTNACILDSVQLSYVV